MGKEKALQEWQKWDPKIHKSENAKKRIKSAQSAKLTPIMVNADDLFGYFQGSHGKYETWLDHCPCGDFRKSHLPCKHIYRLAMELGALDLEYKTDAAAIPEVKAVPDYLPISDTVNIIETLSEGAQLALLDITRATIPDPGYEVISSDDIKELINSKLIVKLDAPRVFKWGNAAELKEHLNDAGIPYDEKMKTTELKEYCAANYADQMAKIYPEKIKVTTAANISRQNVHYYLHRKHDFETYYDPETLEEKQIKLTDRGGLPDDDITNELVKRGYYTPKPSILGDAKITISL